nr:hypothetical protein [Thalassotalea piscium]
MDSIVRSDSSVQSAALSVNVEPPSELTTKNIIGKSLDDAMAELFSTLPPEICYKIQFAYKEQYILLTNLNSG